MKKRFRLGLALLLVCLTFAALTLCASAETKTGTCGDDVTYTLDTDTGVLTISGEGEIKNFDKGGAPWFPYRNSIHTANIANGVTRIGGYAFELCSNLTSITVPDSVTNIGYAAFSGTAWRSNQPDGVVYAGKVACGYKGSMFETQIVLKQGTIGIADTAFAGYFINDFSMIIPDGVTSIGHEAFYCCSGLTSITIPDSVTSIGKDAFSSCSKLVSITIPDGVTSIEEGAFSSCSKLVSITIPDGVTSIGKDAFSSCRSLTNVTIPDSVLSIGKMAFSSCESLTNVTIPDSVLSIEYGAFDYCSGLADVIILNPDCQIDDADAFPYTATIYGFAGSTAEAYATKHNRTFVALDPTSLTAQVSAATYSDGTATLRVTAAPTVTEGMEVERYGVFFAPAKYADSYATNGQVVVKEGAIASGKPFVADLTDIPESAYDVKIYAWAFVKLVGVSDPVVCPLDPVSIHDIVK